MNGKQIEDMLQLIDGNIDMTRTEATEYLRQHQDEIVHSLARTGEATVHTSAGNLRLSLADLEAAGV